jgi:nitroimidazol reductase NimA-like FMN-containing flavoprotein (pyridoxamine 5'-phosphate oxidase superfamily)
MTRARSPHVGGAREAGRMALTIAEREAFLAEQHVASLAVSAGPDRGPTVIPIWYHYVAGGPLWISTRPDSRKAQLIAQTGRFSLLVHRVTPTTRYVSVEGTATPSRPTTDDELRAIAGRYRRPDQIEPYVEFARGEHRIDLLPEHWLSADFGAP